MPKTKLNLHNLSIVAKIAKAKQIVAALTGNPNFPTPNPTLNAIDLVITKTETKAAERDAAQQLAKTKTIELNGCEDELNAILSQIAAHVDSVAAGDRAKIHSAGLDTRAGATSTTEPPPPPSGLDSSIGDHEGELDAFWDPVAGARSYLIQTNEDPTVATGWQHTGVSTKSKYTIKGLQSGKRYWMRVAAVNSVGQSGWSDPATKIAP